MKKSKPSPQNECKSLKDRNEKLEKLISIISRGKYVWESSFDAIATPVMIVSKEYRIERANLNAADASHLDVTELVGKKCYEAFANSKEPCENCPIKEAFEGESVTKEVQIEKNRYRVSSYPIKSIRPPLAVITYLDITEEHRLQREVIQQEKMAAIGMLAGGIAHEINNPLGGILAFTQLILQSAKDSQLREDLKEIESGALRCKKIITDLLDFSRTSKEGEKRLVNINELLERVFPFINRELKSYNVNLEFKPSENLPYFASYPDKLQQVFLNLMTNACHAMPKGGKLKVKTNSNDKILTIEISDTGVGMPREVKEHIFEPFFTTKDPGKGTGLGLAISYRIINEHGGNIEVESELEKGTTFYIHLPVAEV